MFQIVKNQAAESEKEEIAAMRHLPRRGPLPGRSGMTPLRLVLITAATLVCARLAEAVVHHSADAVVQALNGNDEGDPPPCPRVCLFRAVAHVFLSPGTGIGVLGEGGVSPFEDMAIGATANMEALRETARLKRRSMDLMHETAAQAFMRAKKQKEEATQLFKMLEKKALEKKLAKAKEVKKKRKARVLQKYEDSIPFDMRGRMVRPGQNIDKSARAVDVTQGQANEVGEEATCVPPTSSSQCNAPGCATCDADAVDDKNKCLTCTERYDFIDKGAGDCLGICQPTSSTREDNERPAGAVCSDQDRAKHTRDGCPPGCDTCWRDDPNNQHRCMSCKPGWNYVDGAFKDCTGRCISWLDIERNHTANVTSAEDEDIACCKTASCRFRSCRNWFSGGIDPGEVEARKLAKESYDLALQEIKNASEAETRERGPVGAEVAKIVAEEQVRRDKLEKEANMTGIAPNGTYIPGTAWFDQPDENDNKTIVYKAPAPPEAWQNVFGPDAKTTRNNRTGELNIAYDAEGYPKPWEDPADADVTTGTNLDPDPAKYNETDNYWNPAKVAKRKAARLAKDAAAVAAAKAAAGGNSSVSNSSDATLELGDVHEGAADEEEAPKPTKKLTERERVAQQMQALPKELLKDADLTGIIGAAEFEVGSPSGEFEVGGPGVTAASPSAFAAPEHPLFE